MKSQKSLKESKPLVNDNPRGRGGKREGAGRKPSAYTELKRRVIAEQMDEAEKSFDFYVQVRNNPEESTEVRMAAADRILDRVIGRPSNKFEIDDGKFAKYHKALDLFLMEKQERAEASTQGEKENETEQS